MPGGGGSYGDAGGQIFGALGGTGPRPLTYRPRRGNLRRAEGLAAKDLQRLYGVAATAGGKPIKGAAAISPFEDPTLGFSPDTMERMKSLSEGERTGQRQSQFDAFAASPFGTRSTEYLASREALDKDVADTGERTAADIAVKNEGQRRSDLYNRMAAAQGQYTQGASIYNQAGAMNYEADLNRFQEAKNRYAAVGKLAGTMLDAGFDAYSMGGGAAMSMI